MQIIDEKLKIILDNIQLNPNLAENIGQLKGAVTSNRASNQGGYQGEPHWARRGEYPWMAGLITSIEKSAQAHIPGARLHRIWFNINGPGHTNRWHRHSKNEMVGVVYVQTQYNSGDIQFREGDYTFAYSPNPGDILIFNGGIEHQVLENQSDSTRISVACNFRT